MSKFYLPRAQSSYNEAVQAAQAARDRHFPMWQRTGIALAMGAGLAMMMLSAARPVPADGLFMSGFTLVMLDLAVLPWILVHLPSLPARAVHEREISPNPIHPSPDAGHPS